MSCALRNSGTLIVAQSVLPRTVQIFDWMYFIFLNVQYEQLYSLRLRIFFSKLPVMSWPWPTSSEKRGSNGSIYIAAKIATDYRAIFPQGTLKYRFASASPRLSTSYLNPKEPVYFTSRKRLLHSDYSKWFSKVLSLLNRIRLQFDMMQ